MIFKLNENKTEQQKLIDHVGVKLADRFFILEKKLESPENSVYFWLKREPSKLKAFLDGLEHIKSKTQIDNDFKTVIMKDIFDIYQNLTDDKILATYDLDSIKKCGIKTELISHDGSEIVVKFTGTEKDFECAKNNGYILINNINKKDNEEKFKFTENIITEDINKINIYNETAKIVLDEFKADWLADNFNTFPKYAQLLAYMEELYKDGLIEIPEFACNNIDNITDGEAYQYLKAVIKNTKLIIDMKSFINSDETIIASLLPAERKAIKDFIFLSNKYFPQDKITLQDLITPHPGIEGLDFEDVKDILSKSEFDSFVYFGRKAEKIAKQLKSYIKEDVETTTIIEDDIETPDTFLIEQDYELEYDDLDIDVSHTFEFLNSPNYDTITPSYSEETRNGTLNNYTYMNGMIDEKIIEGIKKYLPSEYATYVKDFDTLDHYEALDKFLTNGLTEYLKEIYFDDAYTEARDYADSDEFDPDDVNNWEEDNSRDYYDD